MAFLRVPIEVVDIGEAADELRDFVGYQLGVDNLSRVHDLVGPQGLYDRPRDQSSPLHDKFYGAVTLDSFREAYLRLLRNVVAPQFGTGFAPKIVVQRVPTFRVHLPDNVAVGEFHTDADYNHMPEAVNFWVPLTDAFDTNAVWFSIEGLGEFSVEVNYGQMMVFDGVRLKHGNKANRTGYSRVSFDLRAMRASAFTPDRKRLTINTGIPMTTDADGYYMEL